MEVTNDMKVALAADGLVVPGVGAFAACMEGLRAVQGDRIIGRRLAGGRPVLGICVGMQILFDRGVEFGVEAEGCGEWPGVERLQAEVLPHMGWNTVEAPESSTLFKGIDADTRFYFVHSYGVQSWELAPSEHIAPRKGHGPITAESSSLPSRTVRCRQRSSTPEKSGDAGAELLSNWVQSL